MVKAPPNLDELKDQDQDVTFEDLMETAAKVNSEGYENFKSEFCAYMENLGYENAKENLVINEAHAFSVEMPPTTLEICVFEMTEDETNDQNAEYKKCKTFPEPIDLTELWLIGIHRDDDHEFLTKGHIHIDETCTVKRPMPPFHYYDLVAQYDQGVFQSNKHYIKLGIVCEEENGWGRMLRQDSFELRDHYALGAFKGALETERYGYAKKIFERVADSVKEPPYLTILKKAIEEKPEVTAYFWDTFSDRD